MDGTDGPVFSRQRSNNDTVDGTTRPQEPQQIIDESDFPLFNRRLRSPSTEQIPTKRVLADKNVDLASESPALQKSTPCLAAGDDQTRIRNHSGTPMAANGCRNGREEHADHSDTDSVPDFEVPESYVDGENHKAAGLDDKSSDSQSDTNSNTDMVVSETTVNTDIVDAQIAHSVPGNLEMQQPILTDNGNTGLGENDSDGDARGDETVGCWYSKLSRCIRKCIFPGVGTVLFLADTALDIMLAIKYGNDGDWGFFVSTLAFLFVPAFFMTMMDISWLRLDYRPPKTRQDGARLDNKPCLSERFQLVLRVVLSVATLGVYGRLHRTFTYTKCFIKSVLTSTPERRVYYKKKAKSLRRDCFTFNFIEAFLETVPQLALQLYITVAFNQPLEIERMSKLILSLLSIAWTYSAYYRSNREMSNPSCKEDIRLGTLAVYFFAAICCLVPRFISATLFVVHFHQHFIGPIILAVIAVAHMTVIFFYITLKQKPELKGMVKCQCGRYMYYLFFAYVGFFLYLNLEQGATKRRLTLCYTVIHAESIVFMVALLAAEKSMVILLPVVVVSIFLHVLTLLIFYVCLHPKKGKFYKCTDSWPLFQPF